MRQGLDGGALTSYTVQAPTVVDRLYGRLHRGELEVIIGAVELGISRVILDDRSARQFAIAYGLQPTGTLGILLLARQDGLIPALKTPLDALRESGFRISEALYREALRQTDE
jgi:predicted nucleic acid-binding protein